MKQIARFFFTTIVIQNFEKKYKNLRHNDTSVFAAICTLATSAIAWIFLRLESPDWRRLRKHHNYWFPHISPITTRPGDIFRYLVQLLWLISFLPEKKVSDSPTISKLVHKVHDYYYSWIEKLPQKIKSSKITKKPTVYFFKINTFIRGLLFIFFSSLAFILLVISITQPFKPTEQLIFVIILWGMAISIRRAPGNVATILLIVLSVIVSCRYLWWRYAYTLIWNDIVSVVFGILLIFAETYIFLVMILGYFQTIWPLHRKPVPLPEDSSIWPTVDLMFTTYNENLSVLKPGIYSALGLDWPKDKINIYILDDGNRPEFKNFADEVGVRYIARPIHNHAKAGNINYAMHHSNSDLIAVFDCDFVMTQPFLKLTVGWFLKDPKLAILQTPHHFFSPDPFERNFGSFRKTPNESALFYGVIQDGNDTWNASYFCGSAGILRRSALEEIGGMAVESVTEDAHTSLRLQRAGYNSAYIQMPLAAGLATESLAGHVGQRIRWARGMAQILRIDNPLLGKGLSWGQRLCYFNAMLHFLSGIPRLIFFITPVVFLLFNAYVVYATGAMTLLYVIPHIVHAAISNNHIQGKFRHFLWNEIYETVMAWYIAVPTTIALIDPSKGKFNVTSKGDVISEKYVDWVLARPYLVLILINLFGFIVACYHITTGNVKPGPMGDVYPYYITLFWVTYNLIILGGALGVSIESKQIRKTHRVTFSMPAVIKRADGQTISCMVRDYSYNGVGVELDKSFSFQNKEEIKLTLRHEQISVDCPCTIVFSNQRKVGLFLNELSVQQNIDFIQCTFARPDVWSSWQSEFTQDKPLSTMIEVFTLNLRSYLDIIKYTPPLIRKIFGGGVSSIIWICSFAPRKPISRLGMS